MLPVIIDRSVGVSWIQATESEEGINLSKKKSISYTIEREFLSKISVEELLTRIIESHIHNDTEKTV